MVNVVQSLVFKKNHLAWFSNATMEVRGVYGEGIGPTDDRLFENV
jgi:hypothetical protein